jgi:hypothetical protein
MASLLLLASLRLPASLLFLGSYCCGTPSDALSTVCIPTLDGVSAVAACSVANVQGVLGNKCAGQHNLKTVGIREMMWK